MHDAPRSPPDATGAAQRAAAGWRDLGSPPSPATELLEHLAVATTDLDRLQRLLNDAAQALDTHFHAAATQMKLLRREVAARPDMNARALEVAMDHLSAAITTLQFQDVATQLLEQVGLRLRRCAGPLVGEAGAPAPTERVTTFLDTLPMVAEPGVHGDAGAAPPAPTPATAITAEPTHTPG